jgi:capsular exopolysaccharide synthesis family protein
MMPPPDVNNSNGASVTPPNPSGALQPKPMPLPPFLGPVAPQSPSTGMNASALLRALRRRLLPALTIGLILAVIAGTATWFLMPPPKLSARTQLHVTVDPPNPLFPEKSGVNHDVFMRNQAFLIRDRFVLTAAIRKLPEAAEMSLLKDQSDPLQWLEKEIRVEFPSPEFMHISLSGDQPEELTRIVTAVTESYLENVVHQESNSRSQELVKLKKIHDDFIKRTKNKRQRIRDLSRAVGPIDEKNLVIQQQIDLENLRIVKNELAKVHSDLRNLRVELGLHPDWVEQIWPQYVVGLNCLPGSSLPINNAIVALLHDDAFVSIDSPTAQKLFSLREVNEIIDKDPSIGDLKLQIERQQVLMKQMEKSLTEEVFQTRIGSERDKLASFEKTLETRRNELRPTILDKHRHMMLQAAQGDQIQKQERLRLLEEMKRALLKEATDLDEKSQKNRRDAADLVDEKGELDREEGIWQKAYERILKMELEEDVPARVTATGEPGKDGSKPKVTAILYTPDESKRKVMITSGASIGALALVLFAFAWFEFLARKVQTPDQVIEGLGLNLMGTVPDFSQRGWLPWLRGGEVNSAYTQSMLTESVDTARTMLLHVAHQEKLQIVMITSALAGEGKTSLASHLAASLARAGRRTLLVDSDLRNPTLHRLFQRSRTPGVSELLRGEVDLASIICDTEIPSLRLIPAGKADSVALQALAFDVIPKFFEQLRPLYDFIIVDSCPVLPVADAMLVGQHVDAVIFSLLRDVSRLPRVQAAYQRLALLGIRMLGAVVNGTQHDRYPADYHYVVQDG